MKISIFTTMTNPQKRMDPYKEALKCYEDFADEVIIVGENWPEEFSFDYIGKTFQEGFDLCKGDWVISDRFCGSTLAYQGYGRKLDIKLIKNLENISTQGISPDVTFLLDLPVEESIKRRIHREDDRIDKEAREFLSNVSLGFQELSKDSNWKKISAVDSKEKIISEIKSEIKKLIKNK